MEELMRDFYKELTELYEGALEGTNGPFMTAVFTEALRRLKSKCHNHLDIEDFVVECEKSFMKRRKR
jgi:hypothetical protein